MIVRLTTDGKWPSLALLRIARMHMKKGDTVLQGERDLFDQTQADITYRSSIFKTGLADIEGGPASGTPAKGVESLGCEEPAWQIGPQGIVYGYTTRGCPMCCPWCIVWRAEGHKTQSTGYVGQGNWVRLLDAHFFGADDWGERIDKLLRQCAQVSLVGGINIRCLTPEQAVALVDLSPVDTKFKQKAVYCALDRSEDAPDFERGITYMRDAGWPKSAFRVYMLLKPKDSIDDAYSRYRFLREHLGLVLIHPQVWENGAPRLDLKRFQHYVLAPDHDVLSDEKEIRA